MSAANISGLNIHGVKNKNQNWYQNLYGKGEITPVIILMVSCRMEWLHDANPTIAENMMNLSYADDFSTI